MKRFAHHVHVFLLVLLSTLSMMQAALAGTSHVLPRPAAIEPAIKFWTRVFTEIDTRHGFLHDPWNLDVVYQTIALPSSVTHSSNDYYIRSLKQRYSNILNTLAKGKRQGLTAEERRVLALWPKNVTNTTLRAAADAIRFQLGQSNKFREGLIRSGAWRAHIETTLQSMGLPKELAALPHVESSYNPEARSHVGASGMWQFTHSTGQRFMRIDHIVDERNDPYKATIAAAKLLEYNYSIVNNWALAITAYNHGVGGMRRARETMGTDDIGTIIRSYRSRTFGFASRNFYTSFLAAVDVDANAEHFFGPIKKDVEPKYEIVELPDYISMVSLQRLLKLSQDDMKRANRDLQSPVWSGEKYIPRGYMLRIPYAGAVDRGKRAIASLTRNQRYAAQKQDVVHLVRRGETLSTIAARYQVSQKQLAQLNNLRNQNSIRLGQTLRLPQTGKDTANVIIAASVDDTVTQQSVGKADDQHYQVRRGDTLTAIAKRYSISTKDLMAYNNIDNNNRIYPGQDLRLAAAQINQIVAKIAPVKLASSLPEKVEKIPAAELNAASKGALSEAVVAQVESAEPTSAQENALLGPALTPGAHTAVSVDPSDYSVDANNSIEVQATETLGHYAEWLNMRSSHLRQINRLGSNESVVIGKRVKLDFATKSKAEFVTRRTQYHRKLQEEFFAQNLIEETDTYTVRGGDSLWALAKTRYRVPVWLLRQYNPDLQLDSVKPGTQVIFPLIKSTGKADTSNPVITAPQISQAG